MNATQYACTKCDWTGTDVATTERNGDAVFGDDGRLHEPIFHDPICPKCYANVRRAEQTNNAGAFSPGFMTRRQA